MSLGPQSRCPSAPSACLLEELVPCPPGAHTERWWALWFTWPQVAGGREGFKASVGREI